MNQPVAKYQAGSVSAALWENPAIVGDQEVTLLKCTFERRYRDKRGDWQSSSSFGRNDIPLLQFVLAKAFEYMIAHGRSGGGRDE